MFGSSVQFQSHLAVTQARCMSCVEKLIYFKDNSLHVHVNAFADKILGSAVRSFVFSIQKVEKIKMGN